MKKSLMKSKKSKPVKAWCVKTNRGNLILWTLSVVKKQVIDLSPNFNNPKIVRVEIKEIK